MMRTVAALALLLAVGCSSASDSPGQMKAMFQDLPAPEGFEYVYGYGHVQTAFRTYEQRYEGRRRLADTADWYKKALAAHGWSVSAETPGDPASITFVKKAEQAVVTVASDTKAGLKVSVKTAKRAE